MSTRALVQADRQRITAAAFVTGGLAIATSSVLVRRAFDFGSSAEGILVLRVAVPALLFAAVLGVGLCKAMGGLGASDVIWRWPVFSAWASSL